MTDEGQRIKGPASLIIRGSGPESIAGEPFLYEILERAFSRERFSIYERTPGEPRFTVLARYAWNMALCEALYAPLQMVEVALRNSVYNAVAEVFPVAPGAGIDLDCWLDARECVLTARDVQIVADAKNIIRREYTLSVGRLIAGLSFGFWTKMFSHSYNYQPGKPERFWPRLLPVVFPNLPSSMQQRTAVAERLHSIRLLRNRVFHHEPVWRRAELKQQYYEILQVLSWLDPALERTAVALSRFPKVHETGISPFQHQMQILLNSKT